MSEKTRMELSAAQVIGGALAAASAATAASVLGVYGTVIGAVVVSVVASVGGALYTHSIRRGKQAIDKTKLHRTVRILRVGEKPPTGSGVPVAEVVDYVAGPADDRPTAVHSASGAGEDDRPTDVYGETVDGEDDRPTEVPGETVDGEDDRPTVVHGETADGGTFDGEDDRPTVVGQPAEQEPATVVMAQGDEAAGEDSTAPPRRSWRERFAGINPKAVALTAVAVLVLSLSAVVFVESLLQQPLSSALGGDDRKGGNTISRMLDRSGEGDQSPSPTSSTQTPTPTTSGPSTTTSEPNREATEPTTRTTTSKPTTRPTTTKPTTSRLPTTQDPTTATDDPADDGNRQQLPAD